MKKIIIPLYKFIGLLLFTGTVVINCGKSPSDIPPIPTGSLKIIAMIDTSLVDSMVVELDGISLGLLKNPCFISHIEVGKHQVTLSKDDPADTLVDFSCSPKLVDIKADDTTKIELLLTKIAPDFILQNLNNEERRLQNFRGRVVLLVFFSYT